MTDAFPEQLRLTGKALERTPHGESDWKHQIQKDLDAISRMGFPGGWQQR